MKSLARPFAVAALLCALVGAAAAQNTTVTASALKMKLALIPSGMVTFTPVDAAAHAVPFQSAGLNSPQAFACRIANGALSGCSVPDLCMASPANLRYQISISASGYQYTFAQPVANVCGTTWPLDAYVPPATTSSYTPISSGYGTAVPTGACPNAAEYVRNGNGGELYICVNTAWVLVTGSGGASVTFPAGILHGDGTTGAPTAANSSQVQAAIGAGVYDASGAAAAATASALQKTNNLSDLGNAATARTNLGLAHINENTPGVETITQPIATNDGSGSGLFWNASEGDCTGVAPLTGVDKFCADAVTHTTLYSHNGAAFVSIPTSSGSAGALVNLSGAVTVTGASCSSTQCVVGSAVASVTFSSIPSGYTSLKIVSTFNTSDSPCCTDLHAQFNGDTASNYLWQNIYSAGSAAGGTGSGGLAGSLEVAAISGTSSGSYPGSFELLIPDYGNTTFYKTTVGQSGRWDAGPAWLVVNYDGAWQSTAAVTSVKLFSGNGGNIVAGSIFSVYGVQ